MQGRDIGEAYDRLESAGKVGSGEVWQQPHGAVPTSGTENGPDLRVLERGEQLPQTTGVLSGEVAIALE